MLITSPSFLRKQIYNPDAENGVLQKSFKKPPDLSSCSVGTEIQAFSVAERQMRAGGATDQGDTSSTHVSTLVISLHIEQQR